MKFLEKYPILMIIIGVIGASMSSVFVKLSQAPSAVTAALRLMWVVLLMSPTVFANKTVRQELLSVKPKTLVMSALSGLLLAVHFGTWFEALHQTTVASATIIVATEVIWVAIGFCVFLKGRLGIKAAAAIAVTLAGSVFIAWTDQASGNLYGDALALTAAIAVAGYTLLGRVVRGNTSTTVYTYIVYVFCCLGLLGLTAIQGQPLTGWGWSGVVCGFLLAVFSTILGHSMFSWSLKFFSPTFVSAAKLCEPVLASVFAAVIFGEIPVMRQYIGAAIILSGMIYYSILEMQTGKKAG